MFDFGHALHFESAEIEPDIRLSRERAGRVTKLARWRKIALEPFFRAFFRAFFRDRRNFVAAS